MAKWWHYPAWRRRALGAVMWLLLGATLGFAAIISSHQHASSFGVPIACRPFSVQVPVGWQISRRFPKSDMQAAVGAMEYLKKSRSMREPKTLDFFVKTLTAPATIQDFLTLPEVGLTETGPESPAADGNDHPIQIAGYDGVEYVQRSARVVAAEFTAPTTEYFAGVMLPDGTALAVKFVCDGPQNQKDLDLFGEILDHVAVQDR